MAMDKNQNEQGTPVGVEQEVPNEAFSPNANDQIESAPAPEPAQASAPQSELDRLKAENAAYLDRLARLQADFDNFRKRNAREMEEFRAYAMEGVLKQLLPILDSLDRALKTENADAQTFRSGVELIDRQFHDVLAKLGVEPIEAQGKPFDPNLHQAIQMVDSEEVPDNHVLDELQRGYKLRDRLLRPAMVRVSQNTGK